MRGPQATGDIDAAARRGRQGTWCAVAAIVLLVFTALLGPSIASPDLVGSGPSRHFPVDPSDTGATLAMWLGLALAAAAVVLWWLALRQGWEPRIRRVLGWGCAAAVTLVVMPPLGSSDVLSYGAYGRMMVVGLDPYTHTVNDLIARGDPIGLSYQGAWQDVAAVYGPVALAVQGSASWLTGSSMRWFVIVMQLVSLAAFLATAWLLLRATTDDAGKRRVALLWVANPLVLYLVVNAAHIDVVAVMFGIAALTVVQRSPVAAGVLAALAVGTKVSFAVYALALVWALRRDRVALVKLVVAGLVMGCALFVPFLPQMIAPLRAASQYVARESVWHFVQDALSVPLGSSASVAVVSAAAWGLMAVLVWRLSVAVPHRHTSAPHRDEAIRLAALLGTAWLLSGTYVLPWYDVIAWAPLLLLPASGVDLLVLARTAAVSIGYAPGLQMQPPGWLGDLTAPPRSVLAPLMSTALVVLALARPDRLRRQPQAGAQPPASLPSR